MTSNDTTRALAALAPDADHRVAETVLRDCGWTWIGAGDWAIALLAPDGDWVARISPFDPVGPYSAALYSAAANTHQVPQLREHRRLVGGGDLQVLERLWPVASDVATSFHQRLASGADDVAQLLTAIRRIHRQAVRELPWCGPLDLNPQNVMRSADGRLVAIDPFYADGPSLYGTATTDPDRVVALIPESERRFMTDIPLAASGPWSESERHALREALAAADARSRHEP
ncbi:hypothetical protein [Microbacterium cremeum]|uniref:hypothetical protein n=1 Tax=Microbacterium cremeum TaxID=2782169 RepID=UPI0018885F0B|nr:hypothetical protein [Microbacterium cremeum]